MAVLAVVHHQVTEHDGVAVQDGPISHADVRLAVPEAVHVDVLAHVGHDVPEVSHLHRSPVSVCLRALVLPACAEGALHA